MALSCSNKKVIVGDIISYRTNIAIVTEIATNDNNEFIITLSRTLSSEALDSATAYFYIGRASGDYSHAEGYGTLANNKASHAEGYSTIASSECQHVQGTYNIEDIEEKYAHIVGNGTGNNMRSNAHTLDWSGNAWYQGDVYTGGTSQDDAERLVKVSEITAPRDHLALTDKVTGKVYEITIENGNLIATLVEGDE